VRKRERVTTSYALICLRIADNSPESANFPKTKKKHIYIYIKTFSLLFSSFTLCSCHIVFPPLSPRQCTYTFNMYCCLCNLDFLGLVWIGSFINWLPSNCNWHSFGFSLRNMTLHFGPKESLTWTWNWEWSWSWSWNWNWELKGLFFLELDMDMAPFACQLSLFVEMLKWNDTHLLKTN